MNMKAQQFLLELADLIERYDGADFYYTTDDNGIHIKLGSDEEDCFVGFGLDPKALRQAAAQRPVYLPLK